MEESFLIPLAVYVFNASQLVFQREKKSYETVSESWINKRKVYVISFE